MGCSVKKNSAPRKEMVFSKNKTEFRKKGFFFFKWTQLFNHTFLTKIILLLILVQISVTFLRLGLPLKHLNVPASV